MPNSPVTTRHSVRVVAHRTGLTPDVLRAWERRYGVVTPTRTAGGQRVYSDQDVERLQLLASCTQSGRQIGQLAQLDNDRLRSLIADDSSAVVSDTGHSPWLQAAAAVCADALAAVDRFEGPALESALRAASMRMPSEVVLDHVVGPLLHAIGSKWHAGQLAPANEHLAVTTIRRVLMRMTDAGTHQEGAPSIVVGTPASQMHDLGAMLAATAASSNGWRVVYLGPNLPAQELARAAQMARASVVALSIVHPLDDVRLPIELRNLRNALPPGTALVVGGAGAQAYAEVIAEIGAERVRSLAELRVWLDTISAVRAPVG